MIIRQTSGTIKDSHHSFSIPFKITTQVSMMKHQYYQTIANMHKNLYHVILGLLLMPIFFSCSSKLEADEFGDDDVVGSYFFTGYAGSIKRELEIVFNKDHTGNALEESYSTSTGNLLSAHEYIFTWKKKGNLVYLSGVHASASSDGDINGSTNWSAEFEFKYGMFMPSKGFIEGYAEQMIHGKMKRDVDDVVCFVTYYTKTCSFGVEIISELSSIWPYYPIKYGYTANYPDYEWMFFSEDEDIVFGFSDTYVELEYKSLKKLREMQEQGYTLSKTQLNHMKSFESTIQERIEEIKNKKIRYNLAVMIGDYVIELRPNVSLTIINDNPYYQDEEIVAQPEAIDLGLSVKWASFNVGATTPEENGDYYAWGELMTKITYNWSNYRFATSGDKSSNIKFSKYNTSADHGPVDNKLTLDLSDDVANYLLKGSWRIPTTEEYEELCSNCEWYWDTENGVGGVRVVSKKNHKTIFFPAAGYIVNAIKEEVGESCYFFTSSLFDKKPWLAYGFVVYKSKLLEGKEVPYEQRAGQRYLGVPIRAVTD